MRCSVRVVYKYLLTVYKGKKTIKVTGVLDSSLNVQNLLCNTSADYNFCMNATHFYNVLYGVVVKKDFVHTVIWSPGYAMMNVYGNGYGIPKTHVVHRCRKICMYGPRVCKNNAS